MPIKQDLDGTIKYTEPEKKRLAEDTFSFADEDISIHDTQNELKQLKFNIVPLTDGKGSVTLEVESDSTDQTINLSAGAAAYAFGIIQPDTGTSPTAETLSDTLTLTSSDLSIQIIGNATTDTIDLKYNGSNIPPIRSINTTAPLQGGGNLTTDRTLSITQSGGSQDGYLSSVDWTTFNNKQNYIVPDAQEIYVNANVGNDTSGTGSVGAPYQTVHKAVSVATNTAIQYVFYLSTGTYTGAPLTIPGNISIVGNKADISFDVTLGVPSGSDISPIYSGVSFANFTMDLTPAAVALPVFMNAGFNITRLDATTGPHFFQVHDGSINSLDLTGNAAVNNVLFTGTCTVQSNGSLLLNSCVVGINIDIYDTGVISLVGCTFVGNIIGHLTPNTPTVRSDSTSLGYGGTLSSCDLVYLDAAETISYTPSVPSDWSPTPVKTNEALDQLASAKQDDLSGSQYSFELEAGYILANPSYYKKFTYTLGDLTKIEVFTDNTMVTKLLNKDLTYTLGDLTQIQTTRISDGKVLTKVLAYSGGDLSDITTSYV